MPNLIRDAFVKYSIATGWIIQSLFSTILLLHHESISDVLWKIISSRLLPRHADITLLITITPWLMQRPAHGLLEKYYSYGK